MNKMKTLTAFALLGAQFAKADFGVVNQEINTIGTHDGNTMFFTLKSNELTSAGCNFSVLYCPETRPTCKSMLTLIVLAKATSGKVDLSFAKDASNFCTVQQLILK